MEERYHATTQNRFYPDMSNVNKNIKMETSYQPTYVVSKHMELNFSPVYGRPDILNWQMR